MKFYIFPLTAFFILFSFSLLANEKKTEELTSSQFNKLLNKGEVLLENSPAEAFAIASDLLAVSETNTQTVEYIRALNLKALANAGLENHKSALNDFKTCLSHSYFTSDTILLAELKFNIARCYDNLANIALAVQYYQEALHLFQAKKNLYGQAKVLQNIGIIESDRRKDNLALNYYQKALELYRLLDNKAKQAAVYQNIGVVYSNQEKYQETIEFYNRALKMFLAIKNIEGIASVENNLGLAYERSFNFGEAIKHYRNSLMYFKKMNSKIGLAYIYDNMASLHRRLKQTDTALNYYRKSIMYADSVQALDLIAYIHSELAGLYEETGDYKKALQHYKHSEQIEDSIVTSETRRKLQEAETNFRVELKDIEIQKKEFEIQEQNRTKSIYLGGLVLLFLLLAGLIWAYNKKLSAENKLRKHQEFLEEEVQLRTNELKNEVLERKAAEEADKLKTAFLANMSHEIRTPMNAILAFSNFLKDPEISGVQRNEYVKYINSCSKSLLHLIDDILDTAKIEARQLKIHTSECYINSILNELFVYFQNHRKCQDGDIKLFLKPECIEKNYSIQTDGVRLRQIFTNLLDNAFKFTDTGKIEFGFHLRDGWIEFFVKDSGSGIPNDKADLVFKRFGQVNENSHRIYKGTGLGLSISKNLAELLGGRMWLESAEGEGAGFFFNIPDSGLRITAPLQLPEEEVIQPCLFFNWENFNIIVAEDDDLNFKLIQIALSKSKIKILRANNGQEVLNMIDGNNIDLILMDIQMPVLDGYETTRRVKVLYPEIFVIAQTAFAMADDKDKCIEAGCDDYISKPIDIDELYKKISGFFEKVRLGI